MRRNSKGTPSFINFIKTYDYYIETKYNYYLVIVLVLATCSDLILIVKSNV